MPSRQIEISNRDVVDALAALEKLVKHHGFPDAGTVSNIGKTMRRLREAREEFQIGQDALIAAHAKRDSEGKVVPGSTPTSVTIDPDDARTFIEASNTLLRERRQVEIWPVQVANIGSDHKATTCSKCKQLVGFPGPEEYATLVDVGILLEGPSA